MSKLLLGEYDTNLFHRVDNTDAGSHSFSSSSETILLIEVTSVILHLHATDIASLVHLYNNITFIFVPMKFCFIVSEDCCARRSGYSIQCCFANHGAR